MQLRCIPDRLKPFRTRHGAQIAPRIAVARFSPRLNPLLSFPSPKGRTVYEYAQRSVPEIAFQPPAPLPNDTKSIMGSASNGTKRPEPSNDALKASFLLAVE
jgi:hypothetical protein